MHEEEEEDKYIEVKLKSNEAVAELDFNFTEILSKKWSGYPLDCFDYKSTCGAFKRAKYRVSQKHDDRIF